ncbi:DUF3300 domain-containing protein [Aliiglaciecola sp. LCG003]|uniref:DUF3300 domain-containing protein n=1 Tax=Aliiglaciecola sp. LCG003 TaxID=3053655 RepID=UPI0025743F88|nr:DUF3300 domain-containing protein [Aliiglaciecola sp. LCG003]WJG09630.1 DUF3300 domain-containing protein [Aliiglaciecola sp. LCG003]
MQSKKLLMYLCVMGLTGPLAANLAQAKQANNVISVEPVSDQQNRATEETQTPYSLNQAELDQLLAPIALYPDSVLSHILVASTYPLEVIQAARWRADNLDLDEESALQAVEEQDWDPSVKALVPFNDLLQQITDDLNWLQDLGDAFLVNEEQVLASIQTLRQKAYAQGTLSNSKYIEVVEQDDDIIIEPVNREVIYIPYYDTRVVYGNWGWHDYPPYYWHRPTHYYWHAGLYWSPRVYVRHSVFYGGFQWRNRYTVVSHYYPRRPGRIEDGIKRVKSHEYQRWQHDPQHRRGVRYNQHTPKTVYRREGFRDSQNVRNKVQTDKVVSRTRNLKAQNSQLDAKRTKQRLGEHRVQQRTDAASKQRFSEQRVKHQRAEVTAKQRESRQTDTNIQQIDKRRQVSAESRNNVISPPKAHAVQPIKQKTTAVQTDNQPKTYMRQQKTTAPTQQIRPPSRVRSTISHSKSSSPQRSPANNQRHTPRQQKER